MKPTGRVKEVALLFLRLGTTSFGGPAAHIAIMQHEVVTRRRWIDAQVFLDLMGVTQLIPESDATEIGSYLGLNRVGWLGFITADGLFILSGMLAVLAVSWASSSWRQGLY